MAGSRNMIAVDEKDRIFLTGSVTTTAAAQDIDVGVFYARRKYRVVDARVFFHALDTFASGVDIDLESDDGSTETVLATYDTVGGASATAVGTWYDMAEAVEACEVDEGEWLQLRVDDDEDAACGLTYQIELVPVDLNS